VFPLTHSLTQTLSFICLSLFFLPSNTTTEEKVVDDVSKQIFIAKSSVKKTIYSADHKETSAITPHHNLPCNLQQD
jgi:hypothetical protein